MLEAEISIRCDRCGRQYVLETIEISETDDCYDDELDRLQVSVPWEKIPANWEKIRNDIWLCDQCVNGFEKFLTIIEGPSQ